MSWVRGPEPEGPTVPAGFSKCLVVLFSAAALKNQETGHLFLNDEDELPESRTVIEKGVAWEYSNSEEQESIQTTGPLKYGVLLMVSPSSWRRSSCSHGLEQDLNSN